LDWLDSDSPRLVVLPRAACAERDLDPCVVVPADVGVECCDELVDGRGQPVPCVEQIVLQPAEDSLAGGVLGRVGLACNTHPP
jgi:hypothetical protein